MKTPPPTPPDDYPTQHPSSSSNDVSDANHNHNEDDPNQSPSAALSSASSQQQHRQQLSVERRQWASMSIDRTRMVNGGTPSPKANGKLLDKPTAKKSPVTEERRNNSNSSTSNNNNNIKPLDPSYFMSDVSISEEEQTEIGSSQADHHKKLLYRQKLREFDAVSVGDTSLSSSNISPTPQRFRIQFDSSSSPAAASDQIRNNIGKMRNKIKATAARMSFSGMMQSESISTNNNASSSDDIIISKTNSSIVNSPPELPLTNGRSSSADDIDMLQAALMPPAGTHSGSSAEGANNNNNVNVLLNFEDRNSNMLPPPVPNLGQNDYDDEIGEDSLSSADSVQGIGITITQEQSGGESSSSALQSPDTSSSNRPSLMLQKGCSGTSPPKLSTNHGGDTSQPETDLAKRARRKVSHHHHRRMRSGDGVAATIMNSGREDWIGMNLDNIPMPSDRTANTDDDGSNSALMLARKENHSIWSTEESPLLAYNGSGSTNSHHPGGGERASVAAWEEYSADMSGSRGPGYSADGSADMSRIPRHNTIIPGQQQPTHHQTQHFLHHLQRRNSGLSHDTFDFSDSAAGGGSVTRGGEPILTRASSFDPPNSNRVTRASSFDPPNSNRAWDRGSHRNNHARYNSFVVGGAHTMNPSHSSWLALHQANGMRNEGSTDHNILPMNCRPQNGSDESDYSSGSSASCTSSSYSDNSEKQRRSNRRVKFASPNKDTKFDKIMTRVASVLDKPLYRNEDAEKADISPKVLKFYCPNCKTKQVRKFMHILLVISWAIFVIITHYLRDYSIDCECIILFVQRDFINFATATGVYDSPQGWLALYFALYLVSSLFVFGLEEEWEPLDCLYFSVITLTTAGLGDFVPSSDGAKILCACFIYIGVATIGLLLGSLLAGSMDNAHKKEAREAQVRDCPNCLRLEKLRRRTVPNANLNNRFNMGGGHQELKQNLSYTPSDASSDGETAEDIGLDIFDVNLELPSKAPDFSAAQRQIHTRHMSIDIGGRLFANTKPAMRRVGSVTSFPPPIDENTPFLSTTGAQSVESGIDLAKSVDIMSMDDHSYSSSSTSTESSFHPSKPMTRVKAAKYIFLTMKQALVNSLFIIAGGGIGFYYIEDMSAVDSFYFTTVLLTSVGYGDIVPVTTAGTSLLHNMTLISMIPLELRKRRIEHAVLGQFGDQLTDDELRELSTGRLINRLKLATNRPDGLEECTREMFSLAMLVRLGRITEDDVKSTFAAFRRLDIGNYGKLNSRTIIEGELMRRKSLRNLAAEEFAHPPSEREWEQQPPTQHYPRDSFSQEPPPQFANRMYHGSPNPYMNPMGSSTGSFRRNPSMDSYYSQALSQAISVDGNTSNAGSFNYEEYERWASSFNHYSPPPSTPSNSQGAVSHSSSFNYDEYERWA
ncbi:hypothetical protein ACHAXR_013372, partial [Thalassiosira sp. AJA248-18]